MTLTLRMVLPIRLTPLMVLFTPEAVSLTMVFGFLTVCAVLGVTVVFVTSLVVASGTWLLLAQELRKRKQVVNAVSMNLISGD